MHGLGELLLKIGGSLNIAIALLHLVIIGVGAPAYRYFGAGERMAAWAQAGSPVPAAITVGLALLFAVFGLYAFSAANAFRRLPFLIPALLCIGGVYTLRGILVVPAVLHPSPEVPVERLVFSVVALVVGSLYLVGTRMVWARLKGAVPGVVS